MWRELSVVLKEHGVSVARIDGTRNAALRARFGVRAYPSLFLVRGGKVWAYEESRGLEQVSEWLVWWF